MTVASSIFAQPLLPPLAAGDFDRAARLLQQRTGIMLGAHKREMAERHLGMQARDAGMASVSAYLDLLAMNAEAPVWQIFINAFTINHTAFFREPHHFEVLKTFVAKRARPLAIWSAACSTGEEAWSIAMSLRESLPNAIASMQLLATDIDTDVLAHARSGIYTMDRARSIPEPLLKKYFHRGVGARSGMVRIKDSLREGVSFTSLNLLSPSWPLDDGPFDVIFCRNTLIYFDKQAQSSILERMARVMKPGGLLIAGHSENLTYLTSAFRLLGQTVYEFAPGVMARARA